MRLRNRSLTQKLITILADAEVQGTKLVFLNGSPSMGAEDAIEEFLSTVQGVVSARASSDNLESAVNQWIDWILNRSGINRKLIMAELERRGIPHPFDGNRISLFRELVVALGPHIPIVLVLSPGYDFRDTEGLERLFSPIWGYPIMVVLTGCGAVPTSSRWISLDLKPIGLDEIWQSLLEFTGREQDPEFVKWLYNESGGVPLLIRQMLDVLMEQGILSKGQLVTDYRDADLSGIVEYHRRMIQSMKLSDDLLKFMSCIKSAPESLLAQLSGKGNILRLKCAGVIAVYGREVRIAGKILDRAIRSIYGDTDCEELVRELQVRAGLSKHLVKASDNQLKVTQRLSDVNSLNETIPPETVTKFKAADRLIHDGHLTEAIRILRGIFDASDSAVVRTIAAINMSHILFAMGEIEDSKRYLQESLKNARSAGINSFPEMARALGITLYAFEGYTDRMFKEMWSLLSAGGSEEVMKNVSSHYADVLFFRGLYDMRLSILNRAKAESEEDRGVIMAHIAETLIEMGRYQEAAKWVRRAKPVIGSVPLWSPVVKRLEAQLTLARGALSDADALIDNAIELYRRMNAIIGLIKSIAIKGEILMRMGRLSEGLRKISDAKGHVSSRGYILLLPYVLERAMRGLAHSDAEPQRFREEMFAYLSILDKLNARPRAFWFIQTLPERHRKELASILSEGRAGFVWIKVLGPFKIITPSNDVLVKIGSNKARQLLLTLALAEAGYINTSAASLALMLWPDMPPDRQIHNIHWLFTHIRKTLGINIFRKTGDQYRFDPNVVKTDVAEFMERIKKGDLEMQRGHRIEAIKDYEKALELVEGQPFVDVAFEALEPMLRYIENRITETYIHVANYYIDIFRPEKAIDYACLGLVVQPYSIELKELLVRAYNALGEKSLAEQEKMQWLY